MTMSKIYKCYLYCAQKREPLHTSKCLLYQSTYQIIKNFFYFLKQCIKINFHFLFKFSKETTESFSAHVYASQLHCLILLISFFKKHVIKIKLRSILLFFLYISFFQTELFLKPKKIMVNPNFIPPFQFALWLKEETIDWSRDEIMNFCNNFLLLFYNKIKQYWQLVNFSQKTNI